MRILTLLLLLAVTACGVNQKLENSYAISPGMTKQAVVAAMGDTPVATEFYGQMEEWHYCKQAPMASPNT